MWQFEVWGPGSESLGFGFEAVGRRLDLRISVRFYLDPPSTDACMYEDFARTVVIADL